MAARDRFGGFAEPPSSPLQRYILNACDAQNFEPNLALNLEIADLINAKKGNSPREAAVAIVSQINSRNPNISLLALTLLDICVKNCGYPFHLQISTKEFLNELVRRFPERPPLRYSRVQGKILELVEEWKQTICQNSKYKDDLGFIRDMHRLLSRKGYTFPEVKYEDAAVLNVSESLRSAEEMEEEDKVAQSAKLQELIRRGTPQDLLEANRLMKVMAGYDNRYKTDYRAKAAEEVGKIQAKAKLLEEMLQEHKSDGERLTGGTWEELSSALASAQPKIQKMCEEESDDTEAVAKLLEINDSIHRTLERYRLLKQGKVAEASRIPKGTLGTSGPGVGKGLDNELSLIDLGTEEPQVYSQRTVSQSESQAQVLGNDLLSLSIDEELIQPKPYMVASGVNFPVLQDSSSISVGLKSGDASEPSLRNIGASDLSDTFYSIDVENVVPSQSGATASNDPFASLSKSDIRQDFREDAGLAHPSQFNAFRVARQERPNSRNDLSRVSQKFVSPHVDTSTLDEEWTFSSSLPNEALKVPVMNSKIHVVFWISRRNTLTGSVSINSEISNSTTQIISDLTFELAAMKGVSLRLEPQSGRSLSPLQSKGITQTIWLNGLRADDGNTVKLRWRASYRLGGQRIEEQGEVPTFDIL